ncbi:DUF4245 domain-containing protein [Corynebacterium confusum]|uniref:DUF4245 domain-containing protein n=1 Tax=Corynebacterium confusum TaxID=71254 RepID=UPI0025B35A85|nr:DUF4245 domain-containing protein [Corynebacterium confusum]WJY89422.1 hypothetical protein CCONF_04365 [Corynebacterium confusum]
MAAENKPKLFEGGKDMILSLGVTVIAMLAVVGATGLCTVNPEDSPHAEVTEVDAENFLRMETQATGVPARLPQLPDGWYANSARRGQVAGEPAPIVGFVTAEKGYLQATQTTVGYDEARRGYDGNYRELTDTTEIDGQTVEIYTSDDNDVRDLWAADLGDVRLLVSGSANDADYRPLISAIVAAEPVAEADAPSGEQK